MATYKKKDVYDKIESIIMNKVFKLEAENTQLRNDLHLAQAKLEVYERLATISGAKNTLGFGPPTSREGDN